MLVKSASGRFVFVQQRIGEEQRRDLVKGRDRQGKVSPLSGQRKKGPTLGSVGPLREKIRQMGTRKVQKLDANAFMARIEWLKGAAVEELEAAQRSSPKIGAAEQLDEIKRVAEQCALYLRSH